MSPAFSAPNVTHLFPAGGQRGTTVDVTAGGTFDRWPVKVWASGKGVSVTAAKDKGKLSVTVSADTVPGTYWLRAYDDTGASGLRPFIVGTLPEVAEKEPNDEPAAPQTLDASAVVNGKLAKAGDVDCYGVKLARGHTLVASLEAHHTLRSPMDAVLQVASDRGVILDQNHDARGLDPQLAFTAPADGTYVVRAFAFPATPDTGVRFSGADTYVYRLTLTSGGFAGLALPLAVSAKSPGPVRLEGWNIPDAGRSITPKIAAGDEAVSVTTAGVANAVPVRVEPHPCFDLTAKAPDQPLAPPFTATARVAKPADANLVPFRGAKGKSLTIQVESRTMDLPLTPVLRVLDASGTQLARAEPAALNKDCELAFTPPADGVYRAEVRDQFDGGGPRFAYRIRVVPAEPGFNLTVAADRFTLAPGKSLDVAVTVTPRNGFQGDVAVLVDGLPAGMTAEAKPNSKTVTLKLTATKPGVSGVFRVTGKAASGAGPVRVATTKPADFDATTSDLWLTVAADAKK